MELPRPCVIGCGYSRAIDQYPSAIDPPRLTSAVHSNAQTTVKGVVVESYNAEILSESRRLVASIEQILNVKPKYLGTKVKRLTPR